MFKRICCCVVAIGLTCFPVKAEELSISSVSAVLMEAESGEVLYAKDAHTVRSMASTTKLMTALVAAETVSPLLETTATQSAVTVEGSALGLRAGDKISMQDLLTGLLLVSGNDAANLVAETVAGDASAFSVLMNGKAAALGMKNSHFVTPSGLDAQGHGSTAYDMALLGRAVLQNELLAKICATQSAKIAFGDPQRDVWVKNHNKLLRLSPYCIGLKTGFTKKSGRCLVSAASKDGVTVVAVTLKGGNDWDDHLKLYEYAFSRLKRLTLPRNVPETIAVAGGTGQTVPLCITPPDVTVYKDEERQIEIITDLPSFLWAPVTAGEKVGSVTYHIGEARDVTVPVTVGETVQARPLYTVPMRWWRNIQKIATVFLC